MKIYVAGPMRGYPEFNFPAFYAASDMLEAMGHTTFNPAASDNEKHGVNIGTGNASGSEEQAASQHGFSLREALGRDADFITQQADGIYMLEGWEKSTGAQAEWALARAMGLNIYYQSNVPPGRHFPGDQFSVIAAFEGQIGLA